MSADIQADLPSDPWDAQWAALLAGDSDDPFSVLGPHKITAGQWEIRVLWPGAAAGAVTSVDGKRALAPLRQAADGFWIARIASRARPKYRLRMETPDGADSVDDPYRFGLVFTDAQLAELRQPGSRAPEKILGAQPALVEKTQGFVFAVWAPNARRVSVVGDFNGWDGRRHPMRRRHESGVWELFIPGLAAGALYKFEIRTQAGAVLFKADPAAFAAEPPPNTASRLHGRPALQWGDAAWMNRPVGDPRETPMSVYEVHAASWARAPEEGNRYLTWRELAERLPAYAADLGFTHIELMPVAEYPFDGSWGYQPVSLWAPTSRFGPPEDFALFVAAVHRAGLGLLVDWVPGHFPNDPHGLAMFDGSALYEHADPREGFHPDWNSCIYNLGRDEVAAFLIANARFWVDYYHVDGLRVDAVASLLYRDYSRRPGEWAPNIHGGRENLEAIAFLRRLNETVYGEGPMKMMVAEESTAWPGVSRPPWDGGLGFGFKWNMGWMHDTLRYMAQDPIHRRFHHDDMTFGMIYAFSENFVLPLSHDEVVHGKGALVQKMPGDRWQKFANLRAYMGFMWGHPGKKLLFMGCEFAQDGEWNHDHGLDWHLLQDPLHRGQQTLIRDLNAAYRRVPALHELDCDPAGFQWLVNDDRENSVIAWARHGKNPNDIAIVISNFTPVPRYDYRIGVPGPGSYAEIVNTDAAIYGGGNIGNGGAVQSENQPSHGFPVSLRLTLPPLATLILVGPAPVIPNLA